MRRNTLRFSPLVVVGLTGGIASGKSTVAAMFAELGAEVLNADHAGHAILAPGEPGLAEVIRAFGAAYLRPDGTADRRALGERIFASPKERARLNRITHPRIAARLLQQLQQLRRHPPASRIVILEAALLIEAGWQPLADRIIVVTAQHSTQVERLKRRAGLSEIQAETRVRAQLSLSERLRYADYQIRGEGSLQETREQVAHVWAALRQLAASRAVGGTKKK